MANSSRALNNFSKKGSSVAFICTFVSDLIGSLDPNPNFPGMVEELDKLKAANTILAALALVAKNGSPAQKRAATQQKWKVQILIKPVWGLVNTKAEGDRAKLLTTTFKLSKESNTPVVLEPVEGFVVSNSNIGGSVKVSYTKQGEGTMALYQWTVDPNPGPSTVWNSKNSRAKSLVFTDLPQGVDISFRIVLMASKDQSVISATIAKRVGFGK